MRATTVQWDTRDHRSWWPVIAEQQADLVLLPELSFTPWLADSPVADPAAWGVAAKEHDAAIERLGELQARVVVGSRPIVRGGRRFNESFVWCDGEIIGHGHRKTFLPDEDGYWEASWYQRGPVGFAPIDTPVGRIGIMLCTEMWFFEHARELGRSSIDLLLVPRATPAVSVPKWVAGGTSAAVVSGAFCLSANHCGKYSAADMGGGSWVIEPEEGKVLALAGAEPGIATVDIDLSVARSAKDTYPRYVVSQ